MTILFLKLSAFSIVAILPFILLPVYCFVDMLGKNQYSTIQKIVWALAIICIPILGSILYIVLKNEWIKPQGYQPKQIDDVS